MMIPSMMETPMPNLRNALLASLKALNAAEFTPPLTSRTDDAEVDEVLAEFGGNARAAIGALLQDIAVLASDQTRDA
jgi:hypothetical protein